MLEGAAVVLPSIDLPDSTAINTLQESMDDGDVITAQNKDADAVAGTLGGTFYKL